MSYGNEREPRWLAGYRLAVLLTKRYKLIKGNPVDDAERLNMPADEENDVVTPDKVYTKDELKKLIAATEPGTLGRVAVMFPALTGIRVGELTGATWGAIDPKPGNLESN